jgi:hypothetical protein
MCTDVLRQLHLQACLLLNVNDVLIALVTSTVYTTNFMGIGSIVQISIIQHDVYFDTPHVLSLVSLCDCFEWPVLFLITLCISNGILECV